MTTQEAVSIAYGVGICVGAAGSGDGAPIGRPGAGVQMQSFDPTKE